LIGDAAACVSLLAGEGTGLAMTEAYVLAGELHRSAGDYALAFRNYESRLRPFLARKQKVAFKFGGFFAPKNRFGLFLRNLATKATSIPGLTKLLIGRSLKDDFDLPDYGA
jgi:2-polyprenyl-6-methoxyphenol hydroxylase-like FAD-dependent oxidoreductase